MLHDAALERRLAAAGLRLASVLPAGQTLRLRRNANVSTGGLRQEVREQMHSVTRRRVEALAATLRLDALGVDLVTPDIARPLAERLHPCEDAGELLLDASVEAVLFRRRGRLRRRVWRWRSDGVRQSVERAPVPGRALPLGCGLALTPDSWASSIGSAACCAPTSTIW